MPVKRIRVAIHNIRTIQVVYISVVVIVNSVGCQHPGLPGIQIHLRGNILVVVINPRIRNPHQNHIGRKQRIIGIRRQPVHIRTGGSAHRIAAAVGKGLTRIVQTPDLKKVRIVRGRSKNCHRIIRLCILHQRRGVELRESFAELVPFGQFCGVHIVEANRFLRTLLRTSFLVRTPLRTVHFF